MALELVYIHFPKAAGTSLIQSIRDHYGDDSAMGDYSHPPPASWAHDPPDLSTQVRAVFGHFHADRYATFTDAFRFTFLREPVDNLISIYYFWRGYPASGYAAHERFLSEKPTIQEFAEYPELRTLASSSYFGGVDLAQLDFVGFYERRRTDLARLSAQLGFRVDPDVAVNRTNDAFDRERAELRSDARLMSSLRDRLADDVQFYERAYRDWS